MKRLLCVMIALMIILGCVPAYAAPATDTDIPDDMILIAPAPPAPDAGEEESGDWDRLIADFLAENNIEDFTVSFGYYNTVTGEEHYFRGSEQMTAASVKKVPLNMYYAEKLYNGEISWDTTFGGLPYSEVQELSLRYSNNEYTDILINAIGNYPDYRRAMCPYMGVDPDEMDFGFFTVNEMSAEQAMYCMKLLAAEPERYPGVMDNMLLAAEGEYFEQNVTDYEIAQKYGWYVMDGHNCINCVGIVNMEEPILLTVFSDNCRMGKNLLGEYCALMCEYTEEGIVERKAAAEAEAERLAAEAEAERLAAEAEAQRLAEEAEAERLAAEEKARLEAEEKLAAEKAAEEEKMISGENAIRVVACIIACAVLAAALGFVSRKGMKAAAEETTGSVRNIISAVLGLMGAAMIVVTLIVCVRAMDAKPVIKNESSSPAETAGEFMALVLGGEAAEAEKMLLGNGKLGLESGPSDELGKMLYAALQESFSYELSGECYEESVNASQSFTVTYLDIPAVTALQQSATNLRLAEYLEAADRAEEVQAEDGSYLPEVAMKALEEVTAEILLDAEDYYVSTELTLNMQYSDGQWKIIAGNDLFAVLSGNTAY